MSCTRMSIYISQYQKQGFYFLSSYISVSKYYWLSNKCLAFDIHKYIFACLFSIHNTITLSCNGPMMGEVSLET